ncbi:MAG: winged helix-turn-helix transcriptional regulator [Candidatus Pacebacteria bacterium]|nr:winged helix-turn-helix transcriptional regulator [Candidatus Paceibacterota bacterium]
MKKTKNQREGKRLERFFKGPANHRRIDILLFIEKNKGSSLFDIAEGLKTDYKVVAQHTEKLVLAGLLNKQYIGKPVSHKLSPYGKRFVSFIKTF